jgi:hypothetical protein
MNNALDLFDQTFSSLDRATGILGLLQCVWVYDRVVDVDGLRRFHRNLQRGRLSRRIERSPLPFGRHRWVSPADQSDLEIVATPRPREELEAWLREQAATRVDAERGPGWRLAVLRFTDGGAGVSLVIPHCLTDGIGLCDALAEAAAGRHDPVTWPAAGSRPRWQALRADARQTGRDIPGIARALAAIARLARGNRDDQMVAAPTALLATTDEPVTIPTATFFVDADEWDARAAALGGTSNTLLAGLAARLAQRAGRLNAEGSATLVMPVNERITGDTRANAVTNVDLIVDPAPATADLRNIRAATKQALIQRQDIADKRWELLPLAPLLPRGLVRKMVTVAAGCATSVVSSNLGVVNPDAYRPDGTTADHFSVRAPHPDVTTTIMHRVGGMLSLLSGRANGQVFISIVAYLPGRPNTYEGVQSDLSNALRDFALTSRVAGAHNARNCEIVA